MCSGVHQINIRLIAIRVKFLVSFSFIFFLSLCHTLSSLIKGLLHATGLDSLQFGSWTSSFLTFWIIWNSSNGEKMKRSWTLEPMLQGASLAQTTSIPCLETMVNGVYFIVLFYLPWRTRVLTVTVPFIHKFKHCWKLVPTYNHQK